MPKRPLVKRPKSSSKPTEEDKVLADLVRSLPLGKHMIRIDDYDMSKSPIKMANTTYFRTENGFASLIVHGADSYTKATLGGYEQLDLEATDVDKTKRLTAHLKD